MQYAGRFITRCSLPSSWTLAINQTIELKHNPEDVKNCLEMYHVSRGISPQEDIESIVQNGFNIGDGNKGQGVYFADHSRYAINWARSSPVLVCMVMKDTVKVRRYRTEIYSPIPHASEYVVTDTNMIIPVAILFYTIHTPDCTDIAHRKKISDPLKCIGYVPHGHFGCAACDKLKTRCDCQLPLISSDT